MICQVRPIFHKTCLVTAVAGVSARILTAFKPERSPRICIRLSYISAVSGSIKHDIVIILCAIIGSTLHFRYMHTIVMPSKCTLRWLKLTSFIIWTTSQRGLIIICGSLLSIRPHPHTFWASPDSLITLNGVASNTKLNLSKSFRTHFTLNQISVISAQISGTIKAAHVRTFPINSPCLCYYELFH